MGDKLYSLAYFSENAIEGSEDRIQEEVGNILRTARANNARKNVTGALLYTSGFFAQILEGDMEAVEELFEVIGEDERHRNVTIIHYHQIDQRSFADWSMNYAYAPDITLPQPSEESESENLGAHFVAVLQNYIKRNEQ